MRSLWSWLTWANFEHVQKNRSEDVSEQGRSKDWVESWKQRHWSSTNAIQTYYGLHWRSTNLVWTGKFALRCYYVPTAFLLRPYYVNYVTTTIVSRFYHVHTTLYKTTLRFIHVRPVLNKSVVRLYQVLTASMARPAIKYKYLTEFLTFHMCFNFNHEHIN